MNHALQAGRKSGATNYNLKLKTATRTPERRWLASSGVYVQHAFKNVKVPCSISSQTFF
jgi:hypothetical protein